MNTAPHASSKVGAAHLRRDAYLYVRQSTLKQVLNNTESALRQYDLRGRAIAFGWSSDQIIVIDVDQGQSGASAADREGFQRLVADVGLGKAGIVLGLECSRLARNNADWHRLLEICALGGTLICDEDGLYDPRDFNDRMLLGMKGQLSEAELHFLRSRMRGGILSKARRGELITPLPIGLAYDAAGHAGPDPDTSIQQAVTHLFTTFAATGSAHAVVKTFNDAGLLFPRRHRKGPRKGELDWAPLAHSAVLRVLHNPRYAGVFCFGRHRDHADGDGTYIRQIKPREEWISFIPGAHPGYITVDEFEANQARLAECAAAHGADRKKGPPREGPALLQGIIICGRCGQRMTVRYHVRGGQQLPDYVCQRSMVEHAARICQALPGASLDTAIGQLLIDTLTPLAVEAALTVAAELQQRADYADRLRAAVVERARYHADLTRRRYLAGRPRQPARRRHPGSRLEHRAARSGRRTRGLPQSHPDRRHPRRRATRQDPRARRRPARPVGGPGHPDARTQAPGPPADQRRDPHPQPGRYHRRRPLPRRQPPRPAPARPAQCLAAPQDP